MFRRTKYIIIFILIVSFVSGFSKELSFKTKYSYQDGLSSINISKTKYDKYGYLWIATQDGLFRFDGRQFVKILWEGTGGSAKGIFVSDIHILDTQMFVSWYNAGCGVLNLNSLNWDYHFGKEVLFGTEVINSIFSTTSLFLSSTKGLIYLDNSLKFLEPSINSNILFGAKISDWHWYYLTEHGDLYLWRSDNMKMKRLNIGRSKILQAYSMQNGLIYLESGKIKIYDLSQNLRTQINDGKSEILGLFQNSIHHFVAYTSDSLFNINTEKFKINSYSIKHLRLIQKNVNHINFETEPFLWVSTTEGLELYSFQNKLFTKFISKGFSQDNDLHFYSIDSFSSTQIIASSRKGLYFLDINTKDYKLVKNTPKLGMTHCSFQVGGETYFSSELGVYKLDLNGDELYKISEKYPEWEPYDKYMFNSVLKFNDSIILMGGEDEQGVLKWNIKRKKISFLKQDGQNHIRKILPTEDQNVWILSDNSIRKYNPTRDQILSTIQLSNISLYFDLLQIREKVFVSTYGNGLICLDLLKSRVYLINETNGLSDNSCYEIRKQNDSIIWVSTNYGLNKINVNRLLVSSYYYSDSLHSNSFDELGSCKVNNQLYFSGLNGITRIEPDRIRNYYYRFNISRLSYVSNGKVNKIYNLNKTKIIIPSNSSSIQITLSNNNPLDQKGSFWYRLNSGRWNEVEHNNIINFDLLSYGEYYLEIRYDNKEGFLARKISTLRFQILPPWYQTWWFRILLGTIVLANVFWITQLYYKRKLIAQQKELEKQKALQSERDRISNDMHDDLGSGLSSIKLISELLKRKHNDADTRKDLNEIVNYATDLTDTMRELVWSLNPRNDNLVRFVDFLEEYAKRFFEPSQIQIAFCRESEIPNEIMNGFVRRNLILCIKEIFNNCMKHSQASQVDLNISFLNSKLYIIIKDNGVGLGQSVDHGNGMYTIQSRIKNCNGAYEFNSSKNGFCINIIVPISNTYS